VRRFSGFALLYHIIFAVLLLLLQGCARPVLQTLPASEDEIQFAASAFKSYKILQEECACCLDAEVDAVLSVSGRFSNNHTRKLSGYLQAMEPGYIKFVALNPLGQPFLILLTNGKIFKSINVLEGKAYLGSVNSETFKKIVPPGFDPGFSYYWLTGRLVPGDVEIVKVRRDRKQNGYWLQIRYEQSGTESMILFNPEESLVLRQIVMSASGDYLVDLVYGEYQARHMKEKGVGDRASEITGSTDSREELCKIPTKLSVSSSVGAEKKIDLEFFSIIPDTEFSPDDFVLEIPDNIELLIVN
jgi:hypothetical protein